MTDTTDITSSPTDDDEALRQIYRAAPANEAPARLDSAVLKKASAEIRNGATPEKFSAWIRPIAFAATGLLSLSILLQLNDSNYVDLSGGVPLDDYALPRDDTASTNALREFENETQESSSRIREIGETASHQSLGEDENRGSSGTSTQNSAADDDLTTCPRDSKETLESWLACIDELKVEGRIDAANNSLQRLKIAFPHYVATPSR